MYQNNDYELLEQVKDGSEQSINTLYKKYEPLINSIAIRYQSYLPNVGLEISDLLQEGRLGLMKAINQYDRNRDILFYSYAKTCIETRIFSAITATRRQKHRILNESLSLEDKENDMISLEEVLFNEGDNPESQILSIEKINDLIYKMHNLLTPMESQVFELKLNGFDYKEIAAILERSPKAIDNAIQRIRLKFKELIEREEI